MPRAKARAGVVRFPTSYRPADRPLRAQGQQHSMPPAELASDDDMGDYLVTLWWGDNKQTREIFRHRPNTSWILIGRRSRLHPLTLLSHMCPAPGKGELWLGAMRRVSNIRDFEVYKVSSQICCFMRRPEECYAEGSRHALLRSSQCAQIPRTSFFKLEMRTPE